MLVIALHGFATTGDGCELCQDIVELSNETNHKVLTPTYPTNNPHLANMYLTNFVESKMQFYNTDVIFIGANLGAFWARRLASVLGACRLVLINPTLQPWNSLQKYVGINQNIANKAQFELSMNDANAHYMYRSGDSDSEIQKIKTNLIVYENSDQSNIEKFTDKRNVTVHTVQNYAEMIRTVQSEIFPVDNSDDKIINIDK